LRRGLILASDSRSNAGVDMIQTVEKLALLGQPGERVVAVLSAGNLATTQAVVEKLRQAAGSGDVETDVLAARTLFDAAAMVGRLLRIVADQDRKYVEPFGDPNASFLVAGQIRGEPPRLFEVYAAGNFVEATSRAFYLQIGETKYGKPILDRALSLESSLEDAAKLALLSFDATVRSNLSVGLPIDLMRYEADSFAAKIVTLTEDNPYWVALREAYSQGLSALIDRLPSPPADWAATPLA
jgi:putative proteasome-type protease